MVRQSDKKTVDTWVSNAMSFCYCFAVLTFMVINYSFVKPNESMAWTYINWGGMDAFIVCALTVCYITYTIFILRKYNGSVLAEVLDDYTVGTYIVKNLITFNLVVILVFFTTYMAHYGTFVAPDTESLVPNQGGTFAIICIIAYLGIISLFKAIQAK